ncbi:MAG TPA: gliding motility protein [Prolixibacteraceae bacterium]|jgi:outer membrane lipoprotein-sorting protein|nr:gliding motility protein [Prolixibacteraceae bacterium]
MKKLFIISVLTLFVAVGYSQQDAKAKEILEKVTKTTQSLPSIDAKFSFEMNNKKENIQEKSSGSIILKDKKYKLNIPQMGLQVTCDGKTIWTYMLHSNEVSISTLDEETDDLMDPSRIFTIYERGFNYKYLGESVDDAVPVYNIELTPQKSTGDIRTIKLMINKQKNLIHGANMTGKDGNQYNVSIKEFKTDGVFKDSDFVFDPKQYKGVEIVDLR